MHVCAVLYFLVEFSFDEILLVGWCGHLEGRIIMVSFLLCFFKRERFLPSTRDDQTDELLKFFKR